MDEDKKPNIKTLFAIGNVDEAMSESIIKDMVETDWETEPIDQVHLYISSEGGFLHDCFAIVDIIQIFKKTHNFEVVTFGLGEIASAGFFLFLLGNNRILFPSCRVFVHEHITISNEQTYGQRIKDDKGEETIIYNNYVNFTMNSLKLSKAKAKTLLKKNKWLTEKEIKTFNVITQERL
jgi:ATP-dependent protease ClpP protease subunit